MVAIGFLSVNKKSKNIYSVSTSIHGDRLQETRSFHFSRRSLVFAAGVKARLPGIDSREKKRKNDGV